MKKRHLILLTSLGLLTGLAAMLILFASNPAQAAPSLQNDQPGVANETCLACHAQPDQIVTLPSGEPIYVTIDENEYNASIHGSKGYACVQCHTEKREFPHPKTLIENRRDFTIAMSQSCSRCHSGMAEKTRDSVHADALANGNKQAAVCADCHGVHNIQSKKGDRVGIVSTCERCHSQIYARYKESVHGAALIDEDNKDVPTCIDCHGVHNITGPSDQQFHVASPLICAKCHAAEALMAKYGISTNVFNSYVSDFHGTTVIFQASIPGQQTNKPVCVDCHGVHDIQFTSDPHSTVIKDNLVRTCQKCHPDAQTNFPTSWLSHYEPDSERYSIVYFVDLFYKIFIPGVLGGMAVFVAGDIIRRLINRMKKGEQQHV